MWRKIGICFKNRSVQVVLFLLILGLIAGYFGAPLNAICSVWLILFWLIYVYSAINKSNILSLQEKKIVRFCFFVLAGLALSTVRSFKEILILLPAMIIRGDVAILFWFKAGKSFCSTAIAHVTLGTIGLIIIYLTTDLIKQHSERNRSNILKFIFRPFLNLIIVRWIQNLFQVVKKFFASYKSSLMRWISRQKLMWVFLIYVIPIPIPYLSTIIIVTVRYRNIRYGLWPLIIANILRGIVFVWLVWHGLIHI